MSEDTHPIADRVHVLKDGSKLFLIPKVSCEGCIATITGERNNEVCCSLPPCGDTDAWVNEKHFARWVAKERMK